MEQLRRQHQAEEEEAAKVKQEMQEKAQEQLRKLQQLQETWAINTTASQNEKPKRQKKPKKEVREEDEEESASDSDIENENTKRRKINTASTDSGEGAGLEESADERNVEKKKKLLKLSTPSDIFDSDNDEDGSPQARNFPVKSFSGGLKDLIDEGGVILIYVPSEELVADMLTKATTGAKFKYLRDKLRGVIEEGA